MFVAFKRVFPAVTVLVAGSAAQAAFVIQPTDTTVAVSRSRTTGASTVLTPGTTTYPVGESPAQAIDNNINTKFLSFPGAGLDASGNQTADPTGFVVTLTAGPTPVNGLQFTTANDFASRDPGMVSIEGSNNGGVTYTSIYNGPTGIPTSPNGGGSTNTGRLTVAPLVTFPTSASFNTYRVIITDLVRYAGNAPTNTQFAEFDLDYTVPEPTSLGLLGLGGLGLLGRRRRQVG